MTFMRALPTVLFILLLAFSPVRVWAASDSTVPLSEATHDVTGAEHATDDAMAHAEDGTATEEHGKEGGLPQLNVHTYPSQIFWLLVMFTVLYLTFSRAVLPMIGGVVHGRENMIKSNLDDAANLRDQAESIKAAYEKNLELARAKAVQAVQDVENAAKKKASDQIESFRKKAEGDLMAAEERVNTVKSKAMGDMTAVAAEVAGIAAEKITGVSTDRQKVHAIVETIAGKAKAA